MYSKEEEAVIIVYMAAFSEFNKKIQTRLAKLIKDKGVDYTGVLYRGQPFENPAINSKYPYFSTSKYFFKAAEFIGRQDATDPGNVFIMHAQNVRALDLTQVRFTNSEAVKRKCKLMLPGFSDANFEYWWKSRDWIDFQNTEGEVLVLNKLAFKKAHTFWCKSQKSRKWCELNRFKTLSSNVTFKK